MTETPTEDLAAWLTQVWDEEETIADEADGDDYYLDDGAATGRFLERITPASVLARIAADRKILALHTGENDAECQIGNYVYETCATLKALASAYKGREGWQEAWEA